MKEKTSAGRKVPEPQRLPRSPKKADIAEEEQTLTSYAHANMPGVPTVPTTGTCLLPISPPYAASALTFPPYQTAYSPVTYDDLTIPPYNFNQTEAISPEHPDQVHRVSTAATTLLPTTHVGNTHIAVLLDRGNQPMTSLWSYPTDSMRN